MMILVYKSKKQLKENIGEPLKFIETSLFGNEYKPNGDFTGCNRPYSPEYGQFEDRKGREFFATVNMENGLIKSVK